MNIIIDAMGGDNAPKEILLGAAAAVREYGVQITAVGRRRDIEACARENGIDMAGITVADASETIEMCDEPTAAIRGKKDSSMVVGLRCWPPARATPSFRQAPRARCWREQRSSSSGSGA